MLDCFLKQANSDVVSGSCPKLPEKTLIRLVLCSVSNGVPEAEDVWIKIEAKQRNAAAIAGTEIPEEGQGESWRLAETCLVYSFLEAILIYAMTRMHLLPNAICLLFCDGIRHSLSLALPTEMCTKMSRSFPGSNLHCRVDSPMQSWICQGSATNR